jgi:hypothetical protein
MKENLEQHHAFQAGFDAFRKYSNEIQQDPSIYDGSKIIEILTQFGDIFTQHLHDEIETLEPEKLNAIWGDPQEFKQTQEEMIKWAIANTIPTLDIVFVFLFYEFV